MENFRKERTEVEKKVGNDTGRVNGGTLQSIHAFMLGSTDLLVYYINVMPYDERRMIKKS